MARECTLSPAYTRRSRTKTARTTKKTTETGWRGRLGNWHHQPLPRTTPSQSPQAFNSVCPFLPFLLFFFLLFLSPISIWLPYSAPLLGFFPFFWGLGGTLNKQGSYFLSSNSHIPSLFLYSIFPPFAFSPLKLPITSPPIFSII